MFGSTGLGLYPSLDIQIWKQEVVQTGSEHPYPHPQINTQVQVFNRKVFFDNQLVCKVHKDCSHIHTVKLPRQYGYNYLHLLGICLVYPGLLLFYLWLQTQLLLLYDSIE